MLCFAIVKGRTSVKNNRLNYHPRESALREKCLSFCISSAEASDHNDVFGKSHVSGTGGCMLLLLGRSGLLICASDVYR
jgi:hypothetical protein